MDRDWECDNDTVALSILHNTHLKKGQKNVNKNLSHSKMKKLWKCTSGSQREWKFEHLDKDDLKMWKKMYRTGTNF